MDGYAVRISDLAQNLTLNVAGKAFAGNPFNGEIKAGECVRIMTGALVPKGVDAAVMQEETTLNSDGSVTFNHIPKLGSNIRRIGKMLNRGIGLEKGSLLNVASLPLLASLGIASVPVFVKLKVAILSTGDELTSVGEPLSEGKFTTPTVLRCV